MIEQLKSLLHRAAHLRHSGEAAEAERLFKEAAAQAEAHEAEVRAEALTGIAQTRRDAGDRTGSAIYYAEAITLLRNANALQPLADALRHAAEVRSEMGEYGVAGAQIQEAVRLYRSFDPPVPLDIANALRVWGLNDERQALGAWREAEAMYREAGLEAGLAECQQHLSRLDPAARSTQQEQQP